MTGITHYGATAIALHWLIFTLIACGFALAVYMVDLPLSPQKLKYFSWHKWTGVPTVYLGLVQLPDLLARDKALAEQLRLVHITLNYTMLTLVVIHAAAAMKHHFVDHDDVLLRMLPCVKLRREQ